MKKTRCHLIITALLPFAGLSIVSCSSIDAESSVSGRVEAGVPGGQVAHVTTVTATVTGIDAAKRKVTLVTREDHKFTITAGPHVANFSQIRIGDQLKATLTEEMIIRMAKPGEKTYDGSTVVAGVAAPGAKPGAVAGETHQITGTVTALDVQNHTATLRVL